MSAILAFDWERPPLSLNDRPGNHFARNNQVSAVRAAGRWNAVSAMNRAELVRGEPIRATLVWYVTTSHRRDADNPVATLKALCDGLVDAGVVPDDTPEWIDKRPVRIVKRSAAEGPGVELHLETEAELVERCTLAFAKFEQFIGRGRSVLGEPVVDDVAREVVRIVLEEAAR